MSKRIRPILAVAFTMVLGIAAAENFDAALRRGIERRALAPSRATGNPMVIINLAMQIADRLQHGAPAAGKKEAEPESTPSIASPPREENLIRSFFSSIGRRRADDAIAFMSPSLVGDEARKKTWREEFVTFRSMRMREIGPENPAAWSDDRHVYRVTLDVALDPDAATGTIPSFGWDNGVNVRRITLTKSEGVWRISEIAIGP